MKNYSKLLLLLITLIILPYNFSFGQIKNGNFKKDLDCWTTLPTPQIVTESGNKNIELSTEHSYVYNGNNFFGSKLSQSFNCYFESTNANCNTCRVRFRYKHSNNVAGTSKAEVWLKSDNAGTVKKKRFSLPVSDTWQMKQIWVEGCEIDMEIDFLISHSSVATDPSTLEIDDVHNECRVNTFNGFGYLIELDTSMENEFLQLIQVSGNLSSDCESIGCTDTNACNFDSTAIEDDGSCIYQDSICSCSEIQNIPTLSQWSLIILALLLLIISVIGIKNKSNESQLNYSKLS